MSKLANAVDVARSVSSQRNQIFKSNESRFLLKTGLKFVSIPLISAFFSSAIVWIFIKMDNIFFEANGFLEVVELRTAYYQYILRSVLNLLPWMAAFLIFLFFYGAYVAQMMMRPFESIKIYCEKVINGEKAEYTPDMFADLKLLTRFSDYFFYHMEEALDKKELKKIETPKQFMGIHGPVFDKIFFFHFFLLMSIVFICAAFFAYYISIEIYSNIVELAIVTLRISNSSVLYFMMEQGNVINVIVYAIMSIVFLLYLWLSVHLYHQISGPAFGIFATMRSFLKGNHSARVHLIGFAHVRSYTRILNKYLDNLIKVTKDK